MISTLSKECWWQFKSISLLQNDSQPTHNVIEDV